MVFQCRNRDSGSLRNNVLLIIVIALPVGALGRLNGGVAQANRWFILAFLPERVLRLLLVISDCGLAFLCMQETMKAIHAAWIIAFSMVGWVTIQAVSIRAGNAQYANCSALTGEERTVARELK